MQKSTVIQNSWDAKWYNPMEGNLTIYNKTANTFTFQSNDPISITFTEKLHFQQYEIIDFHIICNLKIQKPKHKRLNEWTMVEKHNEVSCNSNKA